MKTLFKPKRISEFDEKQSILPDDFFIIFDETTKKTYKIKFSSLQGDIQGLDASSLTQGTLSNDRLSNLVTLLGNVTNAANGILILNAEGKYPAFSGENITDVQISNITNLVNSLNAKENISNKVTTISGLSDDEYPSESAVRTYVDNLANSKQNSLPGTYNFGYYFTRDDDDNTIVYIQPNKNNIGLSNVSNTDTTNASNISSGTLSSSRLPSSVSNKTKSVTTISTGGNYQLDADDIDTFLVLDNSSGTVNIQLPSSSSSFNPGESLMIFINTAAAGSFTIQVPSSVTLYYSYDSSSNFTTNNTFNPFSTSFLNPAFTTSNARGKAIELYCVGTNLYMLAGGLSSST